MPDEFFSGDRPSGSSAARSEDEEYTPLLEITPETEMFSVGNLAG